MDYFTVPIICIIILVVAAIIYFFPKLKEYPFFPFCTNEEDERYDPSVDTPVVTGQKTPMVVHVKTRPPASKESIDRLIEAENDPRSGFMARLNRLRAFGAKNYRS